MSSRELPSDWCLCKDGGLCHLHGMRKVYCACGWPVWVTAVGQLELVVMCGECSK